MGIKLLIETSTMRGCLGIVTESGSLALLELTPNQRHARDLLPRLHGYLQEQQISVDAIDAIGISQGPGSFTGLRVGCMIAKTLAYTWNIPMYAMPTFPAIAAAVSNSENGVAVLSDGLQGEVYYQAFGTDLTPIDELKILPWDQLQLQPDLPMYLIGDRSPILQKKMQAQAFLQANATVVLRGMHFSLQKGIPEKAIDPMLLEPIYLRGSTAEEKLKQLTN